MRNTVDLALQGARPGGVAPPLSTDHLRKVYSANVLTRETLTQTALSEHKVPPQGTLSSYAFSPVQLQTKVRPPVEDYSFCSEYTPKTPSPFHLECLQKAYSSVGGVQGDKTYPTKETLKEWNAFSDWGKVLAYLAHLKQVWASAPPPPLPSKIPIPGYETLWFVKDLFLGRRLETETALILNRPVQDILVFAYFRIGRQAKELQWRPVGRENTKILPFAKSELAMTQEPDAPFISFQIQHILEREQVKGTYFGDKRVHEILQFTLGQQISNISYNLQTTFGIPKLYGTMDFKSNCWLGTQQLLGVESWRSMSCMLRINQLPHVVGDSQYILQYGPLTVRVRRNINLGSDTTCSIWVQCGQEFSWKGLDVVEGLIVYFTLCQEIDEDTKQQHLRFFAAPLEHLRINPNVHLDQTRKTVYSPSTGRIFPQVKKGYRLFLGDEHSGQAKTLPMTVAWIRLFDYDLETDDVAREVRNTWT